MDSDLILDLDLFELADKIFDSCPDAIPLEDFGPYRIVRLIGCGGMGEVFLAEDKAKDRLVALKFLRSVWPDPKLASYFDHEVRMLAKLEHPFIARLYEAGIHPSGIPYFAMEYVEGMPVDEHCRQGDLPINDRIELFRSVCLAVQDAHTHLVIHRDLKPSNTLITRDGTPKLLDFGIAEQLINANEPADQKQTELRFTRSFAAPEQLRREPVGMYTDVYSLGVILYQLLAGTAPYNL